MTNNDNTNNTGTNAADTEIADRIHAAMEEAGMSALALSELAGIAYPTLRRSLKSGRSLTFSEFHKIAAALKVQPSALLPEAFAAKSAA